VIKSGVYRLRNVITNTFVDIGARSTDGSHVPVQGHPLPDKASRYDHQYWRFIQTEGLPEGTGQLQNVFSDLFLDMAGTDEDHAVAGFEGFPIGNRRVGHDWIIREAPPIPGQPGIVDTWHIFAFNAGANLNLAGKSAGSPVNGAWPDNNSLAQRFRFEPLELTGAAVESLISRFFAINRCSQEKRNMDGPFMPISEALVSEVFERYRRESFRPPTDDIYDCDDIAVELQAAMAGRLYDEPARRDRRMAFGILMADISAKMQGQDAEIGPGAHAVNWFIDEVWRLRFFDGTTGYGDAQRRVARYGIFLENVRINMGRVGFALM
jgi:hypothetical protein